MRRGVESGLLDTRPSTKLHWLHIKTDLQMRRVSGIRHGEMYIPFQEYDRACCRALRALWERPGMQSRVESCTVPDASTMPLTELLQPQSTV